MSDTYNFENATTFKKVKILPLKGEKGDAGISGDYSGLTNKPSINGVTVNGNMTTSQIGVASQASIDALADNTYTKQETYTKTEVEQKIIDTVYPVGSIYMSVNNVDPATFLSGTTWELIKGKFLLGHDDTVIWDTTVTPPVQREFFPLGQTGGEASHALTVEELPSHSHSIGLPLGNSGAVASGTGASVFKETSSSYGYNTNAVGSGYPHNNMPPYLVVNMWKRTA